MSLSRIVIALSGPASCGKDTAADLLVTHCGFTKMAFADPLKLEVSEAFGIEPLYLSRRETKEHPMSSLALRRCTHDGFVARLILTHNALGQPLDLDVPRSPRQIMQWWGTEYRRHQAPDYWSRSMSRRIAYLLNERLTNRIVITDCRFPNEADLVRHTFGGQLWQIKRSGIEPSPNNHASETTGETFAPNVVLRNDHSIKHLQQLVLGAYAALDWGLKGVKVKVEA